MLTHKTIKTANEHFIGLKKNVETLTVQLTAQRENAGTLPGCEKLRRMQRSRKLER